MVAARSNPGNETTDVGLESPASLSATGCDIAAMMAIELDEVIHEAARTSRSGRRRVVRAACSGPGTAAGQGWYIGLLSNDVHTSRNPQTAWDGSARNCTPRLGRKPAAALSPAALHRLSARCRRRQSPLCLPVVLIRWAKNS